MNVLSTTQGDVRMITLPYIRKWIFQNSSPIIRYIIRQTFLKSNPKSVHKYKTKHTYAHKHQTRIFEKLVPSNLPLWRKKKKKAHKARTCWYRRSFRLMIRTRFKGGKEKKRKKAANYFVLSPTPLSFFSWFFLSFSQMYSLMLLTFLYRTRNFLVDDFGSRMH